MPANLVSALARPGQAPAVAMPAAASCRGLPVRGLVAGLAGRAG